MQRNWLSAEQGWPDVLSGVGDVADQHAVRILDVENQMRLEAEAAQAVPELIGFEPTRGKSASRPKVR